MKKYLIFFVALFTVTFYLSSGNDSSKSSQTNTAKNNTTSEGKGSFLAPKRTPVMLPLPNQSGPDSSGNASSSQKNSASDTKSAAQTDKKTDASSAAPVQPTQDTSDTQTVCTPDASNTCPAPASTDATPQAQPATNCNLSNPDNVIQQYQDNGQIVC
jgi:hypothetical protein